LNLGEWLQYEIDMDIPLLRLPYDEQFLMLDMNTNNALQGKNDAFFRFISLRK
jgi:hypothetical protein